jgi:hypothetical protein
MSFAIAYTVKDEAYLLLDAIRVHRFLGCQRFYIFFDGTTDDAPFLLNDLEDCLCRKSVLPSEIDDNTEWYRIICAHSRDWLDLRKNLNTYWAALHARSCGIEWIGAIDPDEIVLPNMSLKALHHNDLVSFFSSIPVKIGQVKFLNYDNIPVAEEVHSPFTGSDLFLNRPPYLVEQIWRYSRASLRLFFRNSNTNGFITAWFDQIIFKIFLGRAFPRTLRDPILDRQIPTGIFLSYHTGKVFVRTSLLDSIRPGIHFWHSLASHHLRTKRLGAILHYDLPSYGYFMHKFRQRPSSGDVNSVKALYVRWAIAQMAVKLSDAQAKDFYLSSIAIRSPERQAFLLSRGVLRKNNCIIEFFEGHRESLQNSNDPRNI